MNKNERELSGQELLGAMTIKQFTETYGVGRSSVYLLIQRGRLEARKMGARTLITRASAERFFASLPRLGVRNGR